MSELIPGGDNPPKADDNLDELIKKNEDGSFTVGNKRYQTVDDLLKSKVHADKHIETLLREKREVAERLQKLEQGSQTLETLSQKIDALMEKQQNNSFYDVDDDDPSIEGGKNMTQSHARQTLTPEDIKGLVSEALKPLTDKLVHMEVGQKDQQFVDKLREAYQDESALKEAVQKFQDTAGLSPDLIKSMIRHNPEGVANLVTAAVPPKAKQNSGAGVPASDVMSGSPHTRDAEPSASERASFKELVTKLRRQPHKWTPEDQATMNRMYEQYGAGFFQT